MKYGKLIKTAAAMTVTAGLLAAPCKGEQMTAQAWGFTTQVCAQGYENYVGQYVTDFEPSEFYNLTPPGYNSYYPWECVWYACGRAEEKAGHKISKLRGLHNGAEWYGNTTLEKGSQIRSNSILCYGRTTSGSYGHVVYIEQVSGDTVYYTEANVEQPISDEERSLSDGKLKVSTVQKLEAPSNFQGYIYLDEYVQGQLLFGDDGEWHFYKDGSINRAYSGIAYNLYGCWCIQNGDVAWDANGIVYIGDRWRYCVNGRVLTNAAGLAENEYGWWYFEDGTIDFSYSGLVQNEYGWWKVTDGKVDFSYNGLVENEYGWWKVTDGKVDFTYTGLCENEHGNWLVIDGRVAFDVNGVVCVNDAWYKITGGAVDRSYNGLADNAYGWWKITDGVVDFSYDGLVENRYGWWKVSDGAVDFSYNGLADNAFGTWKISNGAVDFSYTGTYDVDGQQYQVAGGRVIA